MDAVTFSKAALIPLARAERWLPFINEAMDRFGITTPMRQAAFLAQTAHESQWFQRTEENLTYSTPEMIRKVWPFRFPTLADARPFVREPVKLANRVYALRNGNGDEHSGDGWRYRGRGLIQLTGKTNYHIMQCRLRLPLLMEPDLLETDENAALSAACYWNEHNLNQFADRDDIDAISGLINRGDPMKTAHKQEERRDLYVHVALVLEGHA